jgi:hypothetical protein
LSTERGTTVDLSGLPDQAILQGVTAGPATVHGRAALRVALSEQAKAGTYGLDYVDEPTFVLLPLDFKDGVIEVDLLGRLLPDAPEYARAYIGLAYRVQSGGSRYESVYLRPLNGGKLNPPPPRDARAVQYYAYPDWKFDRLREEAADGGFEAGADIRPNEWTTLRLEIHGRRLRAAVNGDTVLKLVEAKGEPASGAVGLWIDIGTEGFFADLRVTTL